MDLSTITVDQLLSSGATIVVLFAVLVALFRGDLISRRVMDELITGIWAKFYEETVARTTEFMQGILNTQRDVTEGLGKLGDSVDTLNDSVETLKELTAQINRRLDALERGLNGKT